MKTIESYFRKSFLLLFAVLIAGVLHTQVQLPSVNTPSLPSGSAWAATKAAQSPSVNLYRGAITQSIPIYTVQEAGLSIPISLNYTASGLRVQEIASEVGLGWSLQAGGSVVRIPRGIADDKDNGWYWASHTMDYDEDYREDVAKGTHDSQPDIYVVSAPGLGTVKFTFEERVSNYTAGAVVTFPRSKIRIQPKFNACATLVGFHITGEDGTNYWFGVNSNFTSGACFGTSDARAFQDDLRTYYEYFPLEELKDASDRNSIDLQYINSDYEFPVQIYCDYIMYYDNNNNVQTDNGSGIGCLQSEREYVQVRNKVLDKIITSTTTIEVDHEERQDLKEGTIYNFFGQSSSSKPQAIDKIHITEGPKTIRYDFSYDYFEDAAGYQEFEKRLRLDELQLQSSDNSLNEPPYVFNYYDDGQDADFFPHMESRDLDAFGYYNDSGNSTSSPHLIPHTSVEVQGGSFLNWNNGSIDRNSYNDPQKYGQLVKIIWPTKGTTEFDWEANTYKFYDNSMANPINNLTTCVNSGYNCCSTGPASQSLVLNELKINTGYVSIYQDIYENSCPPGSASTPTIEFSIKDLTTNTNVYSKTWGDISLLPVVVRLDTLGLTPNHNFRFQILSSKSRGTLSLFHVQGYTTKTCGGLRVKSITRDDNNPQTPDHIVSYSYPDATNTSQSSGHLFNEPKFGYHVLGKNAVFRSESIAPIAGFDGSHIGYERVIVSHNGSGSEEHIFYPDYSNVFPDPIYPPEPPQYKAQAGMMKSSFVYTQAATEIQSTNTIHEVENRSYLNGLAYTVDDLSDFSGNNLPDYPYNQYTLATDIIRPIEVVTHLDQVYDTTNYNYDLSHPHFNPQKITTSNSNGTVYENLIDYTVNYTGATGVSSALSDRNIVSLPYASYTLANGDTIVGSRLTFDLFTATGALGGGTGSDPLPHFIEKYERTWTDDLLQPGHWSTEMTIKEYNQFAQIKTSQQKGWSDQTYVYDASDKVLKSKTFSGFTTAYDYYPNSRLIQTITNVDGTTSSVVYDDLIRTSSITNNCNGQSTSWDYRLSFVIDSFSYIKTTQSFPADPSGRSDLTELVSHQYIDGLGSPIETVLVGQAPDGKDIIQGIELDNQRRTKHEFESFTSANTGKYITPIVVTPHSTNTYELSPLGRPLTTTHSDFDYPSSTIYSTNTTGDNVIDPILGFTYPANSLSKQINIDGNGNKTISFTDRRGNNILLRRTNSSNGSPINTYTHYDLKNRPIVVVPPDGTSSTDNLNYYYQYDREDHVIAKKIPGRDSIKYWYSDRDIIAVTQDAYLKKEGKYYAYSHDSHGRELKSGFISSPPAISGSFSSIVPSDVLTENIYGTTPFTKDKIKTTKSKILGTSDWLTSTVITYADCGQALSIEGNNHLDLNAKDLITKTFDGAINTVSSKYVHHSPITTTITTDLIQSYDQYGRADSVFFGINNAYTNISTATYSHKEQMLSKQLGIPLSGSALLQSNYNYRDVGLLEDVTSNLYNYSLRYDLAYPGSGATIRKNGDIINTVWQTSGGNKRVYSHAYDYLNRLTNAAYTEKTPQGATANNDLYTTQYIYDKRGNIKNLSRKGRALGEAPSPAPIIDNLTLNYDSGSNQISHVIDASTGIGATEGFKKNNSGILKYRYDANGNVVRDSMKGVFYNYNHLGKVTEASWDDGRKIVFQYNAGGTLLNKKTFSAASILVEDRDYVGQIEYLNGDIESIYHPEGRAYNTGFDPNYIYVTDSIYGEVAMRAKVIYSDAGLIKSTGDTDVDFGYSNGTELMPGFKSDDGTVLSVNPSPPPIGGWKHQYFVSDHLGNLRLIFSDLDNDGTIDTTEILQEEHYYPFGLKQKGDWSKRPSPASYQYNGIEYIDRYDLNINMTTYRWLDPTLGRWGSIDIAADSYTGLSPYNSMNNSPIGNIDPDGDSPILIGMAIGAGIGGVQNGWDGLWKGAIIGAIGGTLGQYGGGSFLENIAWGAGEGAFTGGVGSVLNGGSFLDGALNGAKWGAFTAGIQSGVEAGGNALNGHGFRTNEGALRNYWESGDFQGAMAFIQDKYNLSALDAETGLMGPNFTYDPDLGDFGGTNMGSGDVTIGIEGMRSIDKLKATMAHEFAHFAIDRQFDGVFWEWGPTRVPAEWNFYDGATGYNAEILNAGRMHISRKLLKSTYSNWSTLGRTWDYGTKSIKNSVPFNPSWYIKGAVKNKWFHTLPRRF